MITLALWLFKIKSFFSQILAFIIAHRRIILPLLIVGYCLYSWHSAVKSADKAELALSTYQAENKRVADAQRLKNQLKKIEGEEDAKAIEFEQKQTLKRLGLAELDRALLQNKLRTFQHENVRLKNRITDTNGNWSERLRIVESERSSGAGMPNEPEDYCDPAHTGINCDLTAYTELEYQYEVLKQACQITTVDLVACLQVVESDTKGVGRYE
jgi:hypothetical protein